MTELQTFASLLKQQLADLRKSIISDMDLIACEAQRAAKRAENGGLVSVGFLTSGVFHTLAENAGRLQQLEETLVRLPG
jgi:hypothetical protein